MDRGLHADDATPRHVSQDARPRALIAAQWFNDTNLRRILIRTIAECTSAAHIRAADACAAQFSDGNFQPFAPSNFVVTASFDWAVQWVAALYDDWVRRAKYIVIPHSQNSSLMTE